MIKTNLFPSKLALGEQFCNRIEERKLLINNIHKARHTVLVSPRRYGKSSLVHYVMSELNIPFASIDLFLAHDDKTIIKRLLSGISQAITALLKPKDLKSGLSENLTSKLRKFFNKFQVSLNLGILQIELSHDRGELDVVDQIYNALNALAELATQKKKKVLIFIDEFQDIAAAQSAKSIQGAIRHVAQSTDSLVFIFSGSNRHLLLELFDDKSMPLYMLCDKIELERMSSEDYRPHLQKLAHQRWKKELSEMTLRKIFSLTELHPFYINLLCNKLWESVYPDPEKAEANWEICIEEESRRIRAELEKLTRNQQDALKSLALYPTTEPTGQAFSTQSGLAASSLHQIMNVLFEKDMTYRVKAEDPMVSFLKINQVRVLDPMISAYLRKLG